MQNLVVFLMSLLIGYGATSLFSDGVNAQTERLPIGKSDLVLEVRKTHAHAFLAEYDHTLILKAGLREIDSKEMTGDSGGLSRIDVLRVARNRYAFRDHGRTVCLDIDERRFDVDCEFQTAGVRIGHFDFDSFRRWRYISETDGGS